jgi:hypothetical protein
MLVEHSSIVQGFIGFCFDGIIESGERGVDT